MLPLSDILPILDRRGVCLPAFDVACGQREFLRGVLGACEAARCPAVLLVDAPPAAPEELEASAAVARFYAEREIDGCTVRHG